MLVMVNFNHERFLIAAASCRYLPRLRFSQYASNISIWYPYGRCRYARVCYEEAIKYAMKRKTFGKALVGHQIIRYIVLSFIVHAI